MFILWSALIAALAASAIAVPRPGPPADRSHCTEKDLPSLNENTWQTLQHILTGGSLDTAPQLTTAGEIKTRLCEDAENAQLAMSHVPNSTPEPAADLAQTMCVGVEDCVSQPKKVDVDGDAFSAFPPMKPIDLSNYTICQILNWTLHHRGDPHAPPLHKLAFLVNASAPIGALLNDPSASLTLFAPDDRALTPPWKRGHRKAPDNDGFAEDWNAAYTSSGSSEMEMLPLWEAVASLKTTGPPHLPAEDDEKKQKRKELLLRLLKMVLKYHISPGAKTLEEIINSSTLPTILPISKDEDAPLFRIRVSEPSLILNRVTLNLYSPLLLRPPILAKNGIMHLVGEFPLIPPFSPLSKLFLYPEPFSTLTTAVQKVGLADSMLPHYGNRTLPIAEALSDDDEVDERIQYMLVSMVEVEKKVHKRTFTIFAPTNRAFRALGPIANAFLFSPFGSKLLRYILSYHIVPDLVFHTDHIDNMTSISAAPNPYVVGQTLLTQLPVELNFLDGGFGEGWPETRGAEDRWDGPHIPPPPKPPNDHTPPGKVNITHYLLPTLLGSRANESLAIDVAQYRLHLGYGPLVRRLIVKPSNQKHASDLQVPPAKPIVAVLADAVAWGGAIHVIPTLIRPPIPPFHRPGHHYEYLNGFWA